jgi:hypothetical protein
MLGVLEADGVPELEAVRELEGEGVPLVDGVGEGARTN